MEHLPNGFKLKRRHLHSKNSKKKERRGHPYVTITRIIDRKGNVVSEGRAVCSRQDQPSKIIGRALADSRAIQAMYATQT